MAEAAPRRRAAPSVGNAAESDAASASFNSSLNIFALMMDINERLKLLNYEQTFLRSKPDLMFKPLHSLYFALPIKPSEQFPYYSHLISWLFQQIDREILEWNEFDDPNTISSTIIEQMKKIGWDGGDQYTATQLRQGYGEAVCVTLDYMSTRALQYKQFTVMSPIYKEDDNSNVNNPPPNDVGIEEEDEEDTVMDTMDEEREEQHMYDQMIHPTGITATSKSSTTNSSMTSAVIIKPSIDPKNWLLEYEGVAPLLKPSAAAMNAGGANLSLSQNEWRNHHESSNKHQVVLNDLFPSLKKDLDKLSQSTTKIMERIHQKEKYLNKEYENIAAEMRELAAKQEDMQQQYQSLSQHLATLNAQYQQKTNEVNDMKARISAKNETMMDSSPVRIIQTSIKELKKEVKEMEVRIGILNQSVSNLRLKRYLTGKGKQQKGIEEKLRANKGNSGKGGITQHTHQHNNNNKAAHNHTVQRNTAYA